MPVDPRESVLWHRPYEPEDVETARALIVEHTESSDRPGWCASGTHVYPAEWACPRWAWAAAVLGAAERGEIDGVPPNAPGSTS
ncbi:hypothetical protein GCM10009539_59860 [Cryptosporangium japonicum]|uniref:Uncharacterized protein n=1 Tax=Cryptosporangium japonicum TaxID=80872 RepID=A0ABN0UXY5_9ACTN